MARPVFKCFKCGIPGHFAAVCQGVTQENAQRVADKVDGYMPQYGLGWSRAQIWRQANNAAYGAHLDHEVD